MNFRELRESRGFQTQQSLAEVADVQKATISQIELGKVGDCRWSTISALAAALGVTAEVVARAIRESAEAA